MGTRGPMTPLTDAQRQFAEDNFGLVYSFLGRRHPGVDFEQIPSEDSSAATWAYLRSVQSFDPSRGTKFSTYAFRAMHVELGEARSERRAMHIPFHLFSRGPSNETLRRAFAAARSARSIDEPASPGSDSTVGDTIAAPEPEREDERLGLLRDALARLREAEPALHAIVSRQYGLGGARRESCEAIGRSHGVSREVIRRKVRIATDWISAEIARERAEVA